MTTRGQINSNFYQIVDVDADGNPTQVKPEYVPSVDTANYANFAGTAFSVAGSNVTGIVGNATHANVADLANSVSVGNVTGIGNIATINLSGNGSQTLLGNGVWGNSPANVTPGGSNTSVQFNIDGAFSGSTELTFNTHPSNVDIAEIPTLNVGSNSGLIPSYQQGGKIRFISPDVTSYIQRAPGGGLYIEDSATGGSEVGRITLNATTVHLGAEFGTVEMDSSISNVSLGNVDVIHINGGTTGQVLSTDGAGNLSWIDAGSGGDPGGSNTQVQFNDSGAFAGSANLTFNNTTGTLTASKISGNGSLLTSLTGANVTGYVANSVQANTVQTLVANTGGPYYIAGIQSNTNGFANLTKNSNIFYSPATGTISATNFDGNLTGNADVALSVTTSLDTSNASAQFVTFVGASGSNTTGQIVKTDSALVWLPSLNTLAITNLTFSGNITGEQYTSNATTGTAPFVVNSTTQVANLNSATSGTVTTNAQPNITSVGTLTSLNVTGNVTAGNASVGAGTVGLTNPIPRTVLFSTTNSGNIMFDTTTNARLYVGTYNSGAANTSTFIFANGNVNMDNVFVTGNVTASRLISNVATGTTPLIVQSTTRVANLNVATAGVADVANSVSLANVVGIGNIASINLNGNSSQVLAGNGAWVAQTGGGGGTPGGSDTQLQFNSSGSFGGISTVTYDGSNISLGSVSTVKITGGSSTQVLSTDGTGNLSWVDQSGGGGGGTDFTPSFLLGGM